MNARSHFDRRGATYDHDEVHHRIASLLLGRGGDQARLLRPRHCHGNGNSGSPSSATGRGCRKSHWRLKPRQGMLAEAHRKAAEAGLRNIDFVQADAERLALPATSFDCIFCSSAIVLMSNIPRALRHWFEFLKPRGMMAFDAPAKPFGDIPKDCGDCRGSRRPVALITDVADTPRQMPVASGAGRVRGCETCARNSQTSSPIELGKALAFWDERMDHPAWQALKQEQTPRVKQCVPNTSISVTAAAVDGYVPNDTALNLAFGRKPG